jgi:hypothetical protein
VTTTHPHEEPRALRHWKARPSLGAPQWRELYADLQPIYAQVCDANPAAEVQDDYPEFFLRHVVETTPSNPGHVGWLRELVREFAEDRASPTELSRSLAAVPAQGQPRRPPLEQVERQLFRVADRYLFDAAARIRAGASAESIGLEPELAVRVRRMLDDGGIATPEASSAVAELPEVLAGCLSRKTTAAKALGAVNRPRAGQIVAIETLTGPAGEIDEDISRPLCALIDRPTDTPNVFWGWMVGAEPDYASEADFVFADEDEPRDPIAATVQLWNPVRVYWPSVARVVGQLAPGRLAALRALAADFLTGDGGLGAGTPAAEAPDRLVVRHTADGDVVITGALMGDDSDMRALYQTMYLGAADVLMQPALQAEAACAAERQASWLDNAEVQTVGLYRFVAHDRQDPTRTVQLVFEPPGSADPLVLLQGRGQTRHDAPLIVDGQRIEFLGGIARPTAKQAAALAHTLGLPAPFDDWAAASAELDGSNGVTAASTRRTLSALLEQAKSLAKASFEVFDFAFGRGAVQAVARGGDARAEDTPVVVAGIDISAPQVLALRLLLPAAVSIDTVEVAVNGRTVSPPHPARWVEFGEVLRIEGLTPAPAWTASAQLRGGHLRIDFSR